MLAKIKWFFAIGLLFAIAASAYYYFYYRIIYVAPSVPAGALPVTVLVEIPKGSTVAGIADSLFQHHIITDRKNFVLAARYLDFERRLKAGVFAIEQYLPNNKILEILDRGRSVTTRVTFPEGVRISEMAAIVRKKTGLDSTRFASLCFDSAFARSTGLNKSSLEGYLLPETYHFDVGISEELVVRQMRRQFNSFFNDSLRARCEEVGMSVQDVVTLASIVEGEAILDEERPTIASVYLNRLKIGMALQADPTIQYLIKGKPRRLYQEDLDIDSPYNTYKYAGLPPGPVNNPGKNSILAVLYPEETEFYYFVADGKGRHKFSRTFREHLNARNELDRLRRQLGID